MLEPRSGSSVVALASAPRVPVEEQWLHKQKYAT
jgi:hypothetical protein